MQRPAALCALASLLYAPLAGAETRYERVVEKVANMVDDENATELVGKFGLNLLNVLWEDTGRWEGSSVGPNISDVTIEVTSGNRSYLMPVMRHDDFTDRTADVKIEKIMIPVGNQRENGQLELVSLDELLKNPEQYMTLPNKGKIKGDSLFAKRDTHVLVSAQHAFLPVPKEGKATFYPVIFNYQSTKKNPGVLAILVTRQGTSMTIIDNSRDTVTGESWGQRLYFNNGGKRAPLIAERLQDVKASGTTANGESAASLGEDSNVLMLIQVPLKYRAPVRQIAYDKAPMAEGAMGAPAPKAAAPAKLASGGGDSRGRSDVDTAVLGHGPSQGPYTELDGLTIVRDPQFPVRVTLQFYQATSNGVVSRADVTRMAGQIKKVYGKGDYVGSLVVPTELDRKRPTYWSGARDAVVATWDYFPGLVERFGMIATGRPVVGIN
jgi:hypothetical protein